MTDEELRQQFDGVRERLDGVDNRFERVATKEDLERFATKLDLGQMGTVIRRHFDLIAESLKADIKVIAEGHRALRETDLNLIAALQGLTKRQEHVELRQFALEMGRRKPKEDRERSEP